MVGYLVERAWLEVLCEPFWVLCVHARLATLCLALEQPSLRPCWVRWRLLLNILS
jgi:hypothetical protein